MNPKILIIIPAYNEEKNILKTYNSIIKYNENNQTNYEVIVINDGSTDNTSKICHDNNIPIIDLVVNLGIGGAVQTGYKYAYYNNYDIAVQFDGDGQHDVNYIKTITEPIISGTCDMIIGSRFVDKESIGFKSSVARRFGIKIISNLIKFSCNKKIYDATSGFRAINRNLIKEFCVNYPIEYPEPITNAIVVKKGYEVQEVTVKMHARQGGVSSIKTWKNAYYMMNVGLALIITKFRRYK
ncbi:MAG: glycosyltransferase family 2 protein [Bacilli bacterium]|nr:glycosyltransferase family 2 protein [Bacilli bacterium]